MYQLLVNLEIRYRKTKKKTKEIMEIDLKKRLYYKFHFLFLIVCSVSRHNIQHMILGRFIEKCLKRNKKEHFSANAVLT